jgi:hypothetical protein
VQQKKESWLRRSDISEYTSLSLVLFEVYTNNNTSAFKSTKNRTNGSTSALQKDASYVQFFHDVQQKEGTPGC